MVFLTWREWRGQGQGRVLCGLALCAIAAGGCVAGDEDAVGSTRQSIIGGELAVDGDFPTTGAIIFEVPGMAPFAGCSGTLIGADLVLTAAHCVYPDLIAEGVDPTRIRFGWTPRIDANLAAILRDYTRSRASVYHPGFSLQACDAGSNLPCNDLGLIRLETSLDIPRQELASADFMSDLVAAAELEAAGYGVTRAEDDDSSGVLHRGAMTLDQIGTHELVAGTSDAQRVCFGDSGGPLFVRTATGLVQIGVTSRAHIVDPNADVDGCETGDVFTRVDSYQDWISESAAMLGGTLKNSEESSGSGGCSAGGGSPIGAGLGFALAALLLALRKRRADATGAATPWRR